MRHFAETVWVRHVFPVHAHRSRAVFLIPALFIILANLFVASSVHAQVYLRPVILEPGRPASVRHVSWDLLLNSEDPDVIVPGKEAALIAQPTRTPRPTSTPPVIPPPPSPTSTGLMILLAALVMAVILAGIWMNRRRVF